MIERRDIERLLWWTYQNKAADQVVRKIMAGVYPSGYVSSSAALARLAAMGVRVDNPTITYGGGTDLDPDAEAVHEAVMYMGWEVAGLVIAHAKAGTRPDWIVDDRLRAVPVMRGNGKPKVEWDRNGNRQVLCPIRYENDPQHIAFMRRIYTLWHSALTVLAESLAGQIGYRVTGPEAPRLPWNETATKALAEREKLD